MENAKEILGSVLDVLIAQQRELASLNRAVTAIRNASDPAQDKRVEVELIALVRSAQSEKDGDAAIARIEKILERTR